MRRSGGIPEESQGIPGHGIPGHHTIFYPCLDSSSGARAWRDGADDPAAIPACERSYALPSAGRRVRASASGRGSLPASPGPGTPASRGRTSSPKNTRCRRLPRCVTWCGYPRDTTRAIRVMIHRGYLPQQPTSRIDGMVSWDSSAANVKSKWYGVLNGTKSA